MCVAPMFLMHEEHLLGCNEAVTNVLMHSVKLERSGVSYKIITKERKNTCLVIVPNKKFWGLSSHEDLNHDLATTTTTARLIAR